MRSPVILEIDCGLKSASDAELHFPSCNGLLKRYSDESCDLGKANPTSASIPCRSGLKSIRHHRFASRSFSTATPHSTHHPPKKRTDSASLRQTPAWRQLDSGAALPPYTITQTATLKSDRSVWLFSLVPRLLPAPPRTGRSGSGRMLSDPTFLLRTGIPSETSSARRLRRFR
jgi:hypothetical protein